MATDTLRAQVAAKWQESFYRLNRDEPGISGLMSYSDAWATATSCLEPRDLNINPVPLKPLDVGQIRQAFDMVCRCRRLPVLLETYMENVRKSFHLVRAEVDKYMALYDESSDPEVISNLVDRILQWFKAWAPLDEMGQTMRSAYVLTFRTQMFAILPPTFVDGFKALCVSTLPSADSDTPAIPSKALWETLETLGLLDRYEHVVASVGYEHIEEHIRLQCSGQWATPMMDELRKWTQERLIPWMVVMYGRGSQNPNEIAALLQSIGQRFEYHVAKTVCDLRTSEIFDIIIDFPESAGALADLKECLPFVDQRATLVQSLRKANQKRLLHPGADTRLILSQYVATIKCLRIIDPPGVLLFKVADPIRRYLRDRPDTIRCIVSNLVGEDDGEGGGGDSLVDENEPIVPLQQPDVEDYSDMNWDPEPVDAGPDFRANKPSDVISTLVSIYDSKDLFVKELQVLLAQRLLSIKDGEVDKVEKERRNIEILKIRFGEPALQVCEVMLKDMTDSKRIDGHVQSQKASIVHPTIISRHFWPMLESSDIVMPGQFQALQGEYAAQFNTFKPDKKLRWLPHLGTVHLELELQDRKLDVNVPPLEAAFIELFSTKPLWSIEELIAQVGTIDKPAALKALITWVDMGVLKEEEGTENMFRLLEIQEKVAPRERTHAMATINDPPPSVMQQQQMEQMKVSWKFVEGMLTNLGALPLDKIQTMLKFQPTYDQTIEQLASFMESARREGLVTVREGYWRLASR
ncbi:hypothetical protein C8J56DRAFT_956338 [Mycena floridula]|nr:hypothetical protein C8J56DRAFT_956338 [Mycena floridula]